MVKIIWDCLKTQNSDGDLESIEDINKKQEMQKNMLIFEKDFKDEKKNSLSEEDLYTLEWDGLQKELWVCYTKNKQKICRFGNLNIRFKHPIKPEIQNDPKYAKQLAKPRIKPEYLIKDVLEVHSLYKNDLESDEGLLKINKNIEVKIY